MITPNVSYLHYTIQDSVDPKKWDSDKDAQIVQWAHQSPEDWCLGDKCSVYLYGSGRHGQLGQGGRSAVNPILVSSFSLAKQVILLLTPCDSLVTNY